MSPQRLSIWFPLSFHWDVNLHSFPCWKSLHIGQSPKGYLNYLRMQCLFSVLPTPRSRECSVQLGEWGQVGVSRYGTRRGMMNSKEALQYASWPSLTILTIFPAEAYRRTIEQIECSEQRFPVGSCITAGKVSSMDITRITLCLSFIAFSKGLKDVWLWK